MGLPLPWQKKIGSVSFEYSNVLDVYKRQINMRYGGKTAEQKESYD